MFLSFISCFEYSKIRPFCLSETIKKPRLRGEYILADTNADPRVGSSPLARGVQRPTIIWMRHSRIIPACAGNTAVLHLPHYLEWDHPRLRGEYLWYSRGDGCWSGSSPLARGILNRCVCKSYISRIIPACAGNTYKVMIWHRYLEDHPRLRGEYTIQAQANKWNRGSSPPARGIH